jgi:hypothetical protein
MERDGVRKIEPLTQSFCKNLLRLGAVNDEQVSEANEGVLN